MCGMGEVRPQTLTKQEACITFEIFNQCIINTIRMETAQVAHPLLPHSRHIGSLITRFVTEFKGSNRGVRNTRFAESKKSFFAIFMEANNLQYSV